MPVVLGMFVAPRLQRGTPKTLQREKSPQAHRLHTGSRMQPRPESPKQPTALTAQHHLLLMSIGHKFSHLLAAPHSEQT